jgi:hypothetical protein
MRQIPTLRRTFSDFQWIFTCPHTIDRSGLMITASWGVAENYFWTEQDIWTNLKFDSTSNGKLENLEYKDHRAFHNLSNKC